MDGIINSGTARNLTNEVFGEALRADATERKFVTFVNELGGVHTIIVDAEHAAKEASELLEWFHHTRALVTTSASVPTDPNHRTPQQVIDTANARMGYTDADHAAEGHNSGSLDPQGG